MIDQAIDELLDQNRQFYQRDMETMTVYQKNFLIAVANGINTGLSRREVLSEYHLESSANVQGVKKALVARDFIDVDGDIISFNDPFFKLWIKRNIAQLWKLFCLSVWAGIEKTIEILSESPPKDTWCIFGGHFFKYPYSL